MQYVKNSIKPYLVIIVATLLLYLWQLHLYPMVNPDGVTYIEAAAAYLKGGLKAAVAVNYQAKWPFYSILIADMHSVTGLTVFVSERVLDAMFICVSACFFLYFVRLFSRHPQASVWAIVIWLTWHDYVKWWPTIVRDHGFLTCLLLSFYCYYRYTVTHRFFWAIAWSISLVLAEFFRIEAVIYLLLIPVSIFFLKETTWARRFILWLKLNVLTLAATACVIMLFANKTLTHESLRFDYMWKEFSLLFSVMSDRFMQAYQVMHKQIFYQENDFSAYALLAGYIIVFIGYVVTQISLAALPSLFFMKRGIKKLNQAMLQRSFVAYLCVVFLVPLLFFAEHVFLNGRYLLPLGLFALLFVAAVMPHIIASLTGKAKTCFVGGVSLLLVVNLVASLFHFGHVTQDDYIMGKWLKAHYPHQTVFTNSKQILFYDSSAPDYKNGELHAMKWDGVGAVWLRQNDVWCQNDLLVLSAPVDGSQQLEKMFAQFHAQKVIGLIIKRYKRVADGEETLVAPIASQACIKMVAAQKNS